MEEDAFTMDVAEYTHFYDNDFSLVRGGAFKGIKIEQKIQFKKNTIYEFEPGALKFHERRVNFIQSLFTGLECPCKQDHSFNGEYKAYRDHIERLLSSQREYAGGRRLYEVSSKLKYVESQLEVVRALPD